MLIVPDSDAGSAVLPALSDEREAALLRWRAENGTSGIAEIVLRQAAALATVDMSDGGPSFGPTFGDFAAFIADMPF